MRFLLKFGTFFFIILIFTSAILPRYYRFDFPHTPGPELNLSTRTNHLRYIEENHPQIVFLGDSTLLYGVDTTVLGTQLGKSVYNIGVQGSASAFWYLVMKNNIVVSTYKPEYVIVLFRDSILTAPEYRVHGNYFEQLSEYASSRDFLFVQNSFLNGMNPIERAAEKYFPLYFSRIAIRKSINQSLRYFVPSLVGCDAQCTDLALADPFFGADLEPGILMDAIDVAESQLYTDEQLDFASQINVSYLPEMIRMANENNIKIIFIRIKVRSSHSERKLPDYLESLKSYLNKNDAYYLDFGDDPRLTDELFMDPIHLNEKGKEIFTQMIVVEMRKILITE